jgi:hypothetical protein
MLCTLATKVEVRPVSPLDMVLRLLLGLVYVLALTVDQAGVLVYIWCVLALPPCTLHSDCRIKCPCNLGVLTTTADQTIADSSSKRSTIPIPSYTCQSVIDVRIVAKQDRLAA